MLFPMKLPFSLGIGICALLPALAILPAEACAASAGVPDPADARPTGANCGLTSPPSNAGEESGHGVLVQVYPRIKDIAAGYNGCQAVFITTKDRPAALAWLVEIVAGDPVRWWSEDASMQAVLGCRFRHGVVTAGDPQTCGRPPISLLPSMPAGCITTRTDAAACDYDGE